jgi:hypothetical protein
MPMIPVHSNSSSEDRKFWNCSMCGKSRSIHFLVLRDKMMSRGTFLEKKTYLYSWGHVDISISTLSRLPKSDNRNIREIYYHRIYTSDYTKRVVFGIYFYIYSFSFCTRTKSWISGFVLHVDRPGPKTEIIIVTIKVNSVEDTFSGFWNRLYNRTCDVCLSRSHSLTLSLEIYFVLRKIKTTES